MMFPVATMKANAILASAAGSPAWGGDLFPDPNVGSPGNDLSSEGLLTDIRNFRAFGTATAEQTDQGIPYFINAFWTSGQRKAHSIQEVSYRACFKPQLPEFFISRLTRSGETVFDPFMGRGTTPVQAALMGRRPAGNDINPLAVLLTRPRLRVPAITDVVERLRTIDWTRTRAEPPELLAFYHPNVLSDLSALKCWIDRSGAP